MLKAPLLDSLTRGGHVLPDDDGDTPSANAGANGSFTSVVLTEGNSDFWGTNLGAASNSIGIFPPFHGAKQALAVTGDQTAATTTPVLQTQQTQPLTIGASDTAEISGVSSQAVTFEGTTGTLKLDNSVGFTGQISGLAGADAL